MKVVAGLGNPGPQYRHTRHNAGWMALDELAALCGVGKEKDVPGGVAARCGELWLLKPLRYMNLCGPPVAEFCRKVGVGLSDLLVVVDDLNLALGTLRLRPRGSSGGHNGLESLVAALGTDEFPRLRLGIGPVPEGVPWREFVLSEFRPEEREPAARMAALAARAVRCWADGGIEAAMNRFNAALEGPAGPAG